MSEQRKFVNLDGRMVRVAETPVQAVLDELLYGCVAAELILPSPHEELIEWIERQLSAAILGHAVVRLPQPRRSPRMKQVREPLRYEQTPYEEKRWRAAEAASEGLLPLAARLYREAAAIASDEWKQDCLDKALMFERRTSKCGRCHHARHERGACATKYGGPGLEVPCPCRSEGEE